MPSPAGKLELIDDGKREPESSGDNGGTGRDSEPIIAAPEPVGEFIYESVEPAAVRIDDGTRRTRDGRIDGRTKAGRKSTKEVSPPVDGLSIKDLLIGIHSFGAAITKIQELEIDEKEGEKLGAALQELGKIYGNTISPKTLAWGNFAAAVGIIYGTRLIAYQERMKAEKPPRQPAPGQRPVPTPTGQTAPPPKKDQLPTPSELWAQPLDGL